MTKCKNCLYWAKHKPQTESNIRAGFPQPDPATVPVDEWEGKCGLRDSNITRGKDGCMSGVPKPPSAGDVSAAPVDITKKKGKKAL